MPARARGRERRRREPRERARRLHARQRVRARRERRARPVRRGRILRARHRGRRWRRPRHGRVDARRPPVVRHVEDGHPPLRRAVPQPRVRARAGRRGVLDLLRHPLPERGTRRGPAVAPVARVSAAWSSSGASSARRAVGNARTGSARTRCTADERTRPRGWAGEHWSPAIGAEALACRDRAVLFDETSFSKMEIAGPGAAAFLERLCANEVDRPVGTVTYTQLCNEARRRRVRPHRDPAGRLALPARDRHRVREPRPRLDQQPARTVRAGGRRRRARRHFRVGVLRDLGPAGARRCSLRSPSPTWATSRFPYMSRGASASARCPSSRCA